jgi:hypothetical protein
MIKISGVILSYFSKYFRISFPPRNPWVTIAVKVQVNIPVVRR